MVALSLKGRVRTADRYPVQEKGLGWAADIRRMIDLRLADRWLGKTKRESMMTTSLHHWPVWDGHVGTLGVVGRCRIEWLCNTKVSLNVG